MSYINDMVSVSKLFKFIIFADDTNLFCSNRDIVNLSIMVCHELSKLETWFALNKLSLNVSKTNYMLFSNFKINHDIQLFIGRNVINRVSETKFLGVIIDDNLNWHSHINEVCGKLYKGYLIVNSVKPTKQIIKRVMKHPSLDSFEGFVFPLRPIYPAMIYTSNNARDAGVPLTPERVVKSF